MVLRGTEVKPVAVVGFPLGAMLTGAKVAEARESVHEGAREIDVVIARGPLKERDYRSVFEDLAAVVFAKLRPGEMRFMGFSKKPQQLPGVQAALSWPALLAEWRKDAEALGAGFAAGDAHVDPKEDLKTCRQCELHTLCRVYEKFSGLQSET